MVNIKKQPRKTRRQLLADKITEAKRLVEKANHLQQHLPVSFEKYISNDGLNYEINCIRAKDLSVKTVDWIMDLMRKNMKKNYELSPWGWSEDKKKEELFDLVAWHLVATFNENNVGFSHFRFDLDDDKQVLYCYELQLESIARRKGLGRFMMHALESIASRNKMQKVVLTVFKNNTPAVAFFHALGYKLDITSPHKEHYIILSKLTRSTINSTN